MLKVAVVLLADIEANESWGRMANALETVKELQEAGDDVALVFDGAATRWLGPLSAPDHKYHKLFAEVRDRVDGACLYCARAFKVESEIRAAGIRLLSEHDDHPSLRKYLVAEYQVLTF